MRKEFSKKIWALARTEAMGIFILFWSWVWGLISMNHLLQDLVGLGYGCAEGMMQVELQVKAKKMVNLHKFGGNLLDLYT